MNRVTQILHDPAGRLGLVLGVVGGCTAIVLSRVSKTILLQPHSRSRRRRARRHVTYPRRQATYITLASGC
jgi:hypothetical protein